MFKMKYSTMDDRPCLTLDLGYKGLSFRIVTFQHLLLLTSPPLPVTPLD